MEHDIVHYAKQRHTTKAYDKNRRISDETIEKVRDILRFSPSSTNSQPWHFILASTEAGKARVARSTENLYPVNKNSIMNASHVVVFCTKAEMDDKHLSDLLDQEEKDGRFSGAPARRKTQNQVRSLFVNLHKYDGKDLQHWMDKQVYLNLGQFLLAVATLGIDATPMEGIETKVLDEEFKLRDKGYCSLVVVCLGYRHPEDDYNEKLPKSRLPHSHILTEV